MQFQSRITVHLDQSNLRKIVLRLLLKGVELHQDMFRILHVGPNLSSFLYCQDPCGIFPWTSMQNLNSSPPFLCIALKSWTLVTFPLTSYSLSDILCKWYEIVFESSTLVQQQGNMKSCSKPVLCWKASTTESAPARLSGPLSPPRWSRCFATVSCLWRKTSRQNTF